MSKYTIVEKQGRGNIAGKTYTIIYQVNKLATKYSVKVYCFGPDKGRRGRFAFIDLEKQEHLYIDTDSDRKEFLSELSKYQEGSSYRKSHPIIKSKLDEMQEQKLNYENQIKQLEKDIQQLKDKTLTEHIKQYNKDIDKTSLNKFKTNFEKLFESSRYIIYPHNYCIDYFIIVYDKELKKYVGKYYVRNNKLMWEELDKYDLKRIFKDY